MGAEKPEQSYLDELSFDRERNEREREKRGEITTHNA
jgi:hypothetical protein